VTGQGPAGTVAIVVPPGTRGPRIDSAGVRNGLSDQVGRHMAPPFRLKDSLGGRIRTGPEGRLALSGVTITV